MPKTKRDLLKRKVGHAYHNATIGIAHLQEIEEQFRGPHPELADALVTCCVTLDMARDIMAEFWTACWGGTIEPYQSWRTTGQQYREKHK